MKRYFVLFIALSALIMSWSCGIKVNKTGESGSYDTVLPGGGNADRYSPETETKQPSLKYNPYFKVVVGETEGGILYIPYVDGEGNETGDITVAGYNGASLKVEIPAIIDGGNVRAISEGAFYGKGNIISISVPDSVKEIGRAAFSSCPNLFSVRFGSGLTELPNELLRNCRVLKSVVLPASLVSIGDFAFEGCIKLEYLYIPESVTRIGHDAFMTCERLTLEVSENEYAAAYAGDYSVNIDKYHSYSSFRKRIIIGAAIGAAAAASAFFIPFYLRRRKEKKI